MTFRLWGMAQTQDPQEVIWRLMAFDDLRVSVLYEVLRLRSAVFVLEQRCLYPDMDGRDAQAMHLLGVRNHQLVAYARCFAPGLRFAEANFGRVLTAPQARGQGLGHALIEQAITACHQLWGPQALRIGAQAHLAGFYAQHGFADVGRPYDEDGIAHLELLRPI